MYNNISVRLIKNTIQIEIKPDARSSIRARLDPSIRFDRAGQLVAPDDKRHFAFLTSNMPQGCSHIASIRLENVEPADAIMIWNSAVHRHRDNGVVWPYLDFICRSIDFTMPPKLLEDRYRIELLDCYTRIITDSKIKADRPNHFARKHWHDLVVKNDKFKIENYFFRSQGYSCAGLAYRNLIMDYLTSHDLLNAVDGRADTDWI